MAAGDLSLVEKDKPLCLTCADLDHLVFLPACDMALSRRSKKLSPLSAIVVKFNKSRKRYERQGILVTTQAQGRVAVLVPVDPRTTGIKTASGGITSRDLPRRRTAVRPEAST